MKLAVTKETLVGDVLKADRTTEPYFLQMGMFCLSCPSAAEESLEDACMVHGVSVDELIDKLNEHASK